jgi:phage gp29-like protein
MTTERQDELLEMGINSISNSVVVLTSGEKIEVPNIPNTDSYRVFKEMISLIDSQLSKRVLGQDGTTDHKESNGTYGSLQILQDVANDRHESDKLFAQYLINKELIPRLVKLSSFYAPLANLSFDWDTSEEMEKGALIDKAVALTNAGYILDYEILADKTGLPITGFNSVSTPETEELDEDGKPVKKKAKSQE